MFLMMKWVFENGFRRYEWKCNAENLRSRKAAQRLGFSYEGVFRQMSISKGKNRNTAWFAMIDNEWKKIKGYSQIGIGPLLNKLHLIFMIMIDILIMLVDQGHSQAYLLIQIQ